MKIHLGHFIKQLKWSTYGFIALKKNPVKIQCTRVRPHPLSRSCLPYIVSLKWKLEKENSLWSELVFQKHTFCQLNGSIYACQSHFITKPEDWYHSDLCINIVISNKTMKTLLNWNCPYYTCKNLFTLFWWGWSITEN